ncbi:MAG TPA: hypothetical protein VFT66_06175 [Roseiflexaceae bacterium]|jgi:hypothetical protein|nr:hypothetical protein [Roseiflexaceae bacterium]
MERESFIETADEQRCADGTLARRSAPAQSLQSRKIYAIAKTFCQAARGIYTAAIMRMAALAEQARDLV